MAAATSPKSLPTDWTAADLVDRFGPIPLWRVRLVPAPGTATEQDVIEIHDREDRLCELVDGVLVEKTGGIPEGFPVLTAADLVDRFGPISLRRLRHDPAPGTATEQDVIDIRDREKRLYELVDGILVEKAVGYQSSYLAVVISSLIWAFVKERGLGIVLGADGMTQLAPGLIRIPDVSFIPWERHPDRRVPALPCAPFAPSLAVEVLSPSNTAREMSQKLVDYFAAGVRLVWYVDPERRSVEVFTAADRSVVLREGGALDGGDVLPGFVLPLAQLFADLGPGPAGP
jgi:Uma2 family endonuclease